MPSFAVLLSIGAIGFYLLDATLLLYGNELVLEWRRGAWRSSSGFRMQVAGRRPFMPNPLAPHALLFRAYWGARSRHAGEPLDVAQLGARLAPVRLIVTLQAVLLFLALPALSIGFGAGVPLLLLFVAFYLLTSLSIAFVFSRREALGLTTRQCAGFTLEALLCAPFAINLVRKVSLARSEQLAWLECARTEFEEDPRRELLRQVEARIEEALFGEELGSAASGRLEALRASFKEQLGGRDVA